MDNSESIQDYCLRVVSIVNQICGLGYKLGKDDVVSRVLRRLHPKFDFVAVAIKESNDTLKLILAELSGPLQAHEVMMNETGVKLG